MKCAFCELRETKERIIVEDELAFAFPTNIPIVPGHALIAPKRCVCMADDLTDAERVALENMRQKICRALTEAFGATGFNFAWNEGSTAGQSVPHFHLHIVPRKQGDTGITEYEPRRFLYRQGSREPSPEAELREITRLIRKAL